MLHNAPNGHQYVLNGHHILFKTARWAQKCRSITQEPDEMERLSRANKRDDSSPPDNFGEMDGGVDLMRTPVSLCGWYVVSFITGMIYEE